MKWFRFYSDALDDPKVQRLPDYLFKRWVNLLCLANEGEPRGVLPSIEDIAFRLRISADEAAETVAELSRRGLLDDNDETLHPHNWENRQRRSDDVAARVQKHRAKQEGPVTAPVTDNVTETPQRRLDTDTDTDADPEERKTTEPARARATVALDTPYAVFSAFLEEIGTYEADVAPAWKKKQLGVAKRLVEQGFGADKVRRYVRYMRSETWRTSPFDLFTVEKGIGTWEANGSPTVAEARASPNGRRRNEPDYSGIEEFSRRMDAIEAEGRVK